jgi:uncharacterized repeat protein (TIGR03803 family)
MRKINRAFVVSAVLLFILLAPMTAPAQTFTVLHTFDGADGANSTAALLQATDGNLYGTTTEAPPSGCGTIFKMTLAGALTTLYGDLCSADDGYYPAAGLAQGRDGNFYGTMEYGGAYKGGTVFKMSPSGALTTIYSFCSQSECTDGENPAAPLLYALDGNFYGTAQFGGTNSYGTIFKVTPGGTLTTLHSFDLNDGAFPYGALVEGPGGVFYGTTNNGGASDQGTVFRIDQNGGLVTLHNFDFADGALPYAGLVMGSDGNFYGTTSTGGSRGGGTVFEITSTGTLTTLHNFCSQKGCGDGDDPIGGLVQATDGSFYGTTSHGGSGDAGGGGTIFRVTSHGDFTVVTKFESTEEGSEPFAALIQDTDGGLYGTTFDGPLFGGCQGDAGCGSVFSLSVGLTPFVETQPGLGSTGARIRILGGHLTGATNVTFNGTPATFSVASRSLITTTVPAGATTGTVQVVTPGGTLSSNVPFRVIQ